MTDRDEKQRYEIYGEEQEGETLHFTLSFILPDTDPEYDANDPIYNLEFQYTTGSVYNLMSRCWEDRDSMIELCDGQYVPDSISKALQYGFLEENLERALEEKLYYGKTPVVGSYTGMPIWYRDDMNIPPRNLLAII